MEEDIFVEKSFEEQEIDFKTHYNLGLAYKDMELFDDAIEEFQIAVRANGKQYTDDQYFDCCKNLGLCFMRNGMARPAVIWYQRALNVPGQLYQDYLFVKQDLSLAKQFLNDDLDGDDLLPVC
jgi:tetratricopeptide (TPR) repeat protein